jgi:hypothetical protein
MLPAVQSLRRSWSEGRVRRARVQSLACPGLFGEGEPRTGFCGIVLGTGGAASGSRHPRLVTGRPYGTGACGGAGWERGGAGVLGELEWCRASGLAPGKRQQSYAVQGLRLGWFGGAGRRTSCAERAVILPAVQSLRLLGRRGGPLRGPVLRCWEPGVPRVARGTPG